MCVFFCLVRGFGVGWSFGGEGGLPEEVLLLLEESSIDERMKVGHATAARGDRGGPVKAGQRIDPVVENGKGREAANLKGIHHATAATAAHLTTRRREPAAVHEPRNHWSKGFRDLKNRSDVDQQPNRNRNSSLAYLEEQHVAVDVLEHVLVHLLDDVVGEDPEEQWTQLAAAGLC